MSAAAAIQTDVIKSETSPPNTYPPTESMVGKPSDGLVAPRVGHLELMSPDNILVQTEVQLILRKRTCSPKNSFQKCHMMVETLDSLYNKNNTH